MNRTSPAKMAGHQVTIGLGPEGSERSGKGRTRFESRKRKESAQGLAMEILLQDRSILSRTSIAGNQGDYSSFTAGLHLSYLSGSSAMRFLPSSSASTSKRRTPGYLGGSYSSLRRTESSLTVSATVIGPGPARHVRARFTSSTRPQPESIPIR